ncbi:MAG: uncharacterized protein QOD86_1528 [Miltoncostaeaceae bacterium]|jgi:uncharacterized protein YcbX|nr:uncharacterized protein [Miltoncostaeaceae bacterium]
MHVESLWRYPVKSLGGEPLSEAELTLDGVAGDRLVHVAVPWGPITGRTKHGLLTIPASTGPDGRPLVAGHPWDGPEAAEMIRATAGDHARLVAYDGPERFDVLNLLVATDGGVADLGVDVRRLRPNLLIGGVEPGEERTWGGRALAIGDALIGILNLRQRCVVTTIDPDTGEQDVGVLRDINDRFEGRVALNCWVIRPGTIRPGEPVELVDAPARPEHVGGWVVGAPYLVDG